MLHYGYLNEPNTMMFHITLMSLRSQVYHVNQTPPYNLTLRIYKWIKHHDIEHYANIIMITDTSSEPNIPLFFSLKFKQTNKGAPPFPWRGIIWLTEIYTVIPNINKPLLWPCSANIFISLAINNSHFPVINAQIGGNILAFYAKISRLISMSL